MSTRIALGLAFAAACALAQAQDGTRYHATFIEYSKGWGAVVADFDRDGHDDIFVTGHDRDDRIWYWTPTGYVPGPQDLVNEATPRSDGEPNINHVFINQGGHGFIERQTIATGAIGYGCSAKGDIDGDGWDDLAICGDPGRTGHLFVNNRVGDFTELATPATTVPWIDAKLADVDGDGRDDLVLVDSHDRFQIWLNTGTSPSYTAPALTYALPGRGASVAVGDFDGNGRKDVYVVLQDADCRTTLVDLAPDLVFWGQAGGGWVAQAQPQPPGLAGCGHLAATVDGDKILLEQAGEGWNGPNYVLRGK